MSTTDSRSRRARSWLSGCVVAIGLLTACSSGDSEESASAGSDGGSSVATTIDESPVASTDRVASTPDEGDPPTTEVADDDSASTAPPNSAAAPSTGDVTEVVEAEPQERLEPVGFDEATQTDDGVSISILEVEQVEAEARLPGEIAGPALLVSVEIVNRSTNPIDLSQFTVNLFDAEDVASSPLTTEPAAPFEGTLAAGESAQGAYLFSFEAGRPQPVTVEASHSVEQPVALFEGSTA